MLLSNDDGYDAAGLVAVREALQAVGYAVIVVAPLSQQSGSGVRVTLENVEEKERSVRFRIEAQLRVEPSPEPVVFDTMLQVGSGEVRVQEK